MSDGKPRLSNKLKKEIDVSLSKVEHIIRHIKNVQDNCLLLGQRLIERGEINLGKMLIAQGLQHDNSKFFGTEWDNMNIVPINSVDVDPVKLKRNLSVNHHRQTNSHHPEYWPHGIKEMPDIFLLECICDWKSRSEEFGNSLHDWIDSDATERFGFKKDGGIYNKIMKYVDLLCQTPFSEIK
jgi:hypothetical protein